MTSAEAEVVTNQEPATVQPQVPPYTPHPNPLGTSDDHIENPPEYYDPDTPLAFEELYRILSDGTRAQEDDVKIWRRYINTCRPEERTAGEKNDIVSLYFSAIIANQEDVVALLIENHLVTANTKNAEANDTGTTKTAILTPLIIAVSGGNVQMTRRLLELGADPNEFGCATWSYETSHWNKMRVTMRTPLQVAASNGHLVLVKLLMEQYHSDDSLVAPDGQIALRLAADGGHHAIVEYLPARRGGGFQRWKHNNKAFLKKAKGAARNIGKFVKFFVWDIEKFFLWTMTTKPLIRGCTWATKHWKEFKPWCLRHLGEMPGRVKRFAKKTGEFVLRILVLSPRFAWALLTIGLPASVAILARWVTSLAKLAWNAILKVASLLSTTVEAILSIFQRVTMKDIWNGFKDVLTAVFVAFPKSINSSIVAFLNGSYGFMHTMFGFTGRALFGLGVITINVITFVPRMLGVMLASFGRSMAKAGNEVRVWVNPKVSR